MVQELRQFQISLAKVSILALLALLPVALFHICVDPYGVFLRLYDHSPIEPNKRYIKIKHILEHPDKYDSFIFGNSRVNAFHTDQFPEGRFYNMSYSIGIPSYHLEEIKFLLKKGIKLKHLVIALDHTSLIENNMVAEDDLLRKRFPMGLLEALKFYTSYLFYIPSKEFVHTVLSGSDFDWSKLDEHGFIESTDIVYQTHPKVHVQSSGFQQKLVYLDRDPHIQRDIETIRELKMLADEQGIKITFFLNPVFHTAFTTINLPAYYAAVRQLATVTPFYDFSGIHEETLDKRNYHESSHYTSVLANKMTQILFSTEIQTDYTFGTYVDPANVENHIQNHLSALSTYFKSINPLDTSRTDLQYRKVPLPESHDQSKIYFSTTKDTLLVSSSLIPLGVESSESFDPKNYHIRSHGKSIPFVKIVRHYNPSGTSMTKFTCWIESKHLGEGNHIVFLGHKQRKSFGILDSLTISIIGADGLSRRWRLCESPDTTTLGSLEQMHYVPFATGQAPEKIKGLVNLEGWLALSATKLPADEIFVKYEDKLFPVCFKTHRPDVNQFISAANQLNYGFYVTLPTSSENVVRSQFQFWLINKQNQSCEIFTSK